MAAEQPTKLPQWATTAGTTLEPSGGEKAGVKGTGDPGVEGIGSGGPGIEATGASGYEGIIGARDQNLDRARGPASRCGKHSIGQG